MVARRLCCADPSLDHCVKAEPAGTQDRNDECEYCERQVQLVTGGWRRGVDPRCPGDRDHRHHLVSEERDARQPGAKAEGERDAASELDAPAQHREEATGMQVSNL